MAAINLTGYNLHTDLIIEKETHTTSEEIIDDIIISKTYKSGNYITLSFEDITDKDNYDKVLKQLNKLIEEILNKNNITNNASCLVIGLGNVLSTPDSLGVKVANNLIITRHLYLLNKVSPGYRMVSSLTPGVMSSTGIETADIIEAIIKKIKPDFVIAIDALAARNIERINKTIQLTDTGIHPGSGIGNNRHEISFKTMGIPVIAIGVPTVVLSSTIVYDTIDYLIKHIAYIKEHEATTKLSYGSKNYLKKIKQSNLTNEDKNNLLGLLGSLSKTDSSALIDEVLTKTSLNYIVTPTEIDFLIDKLSTLIASSLNTILHPVNKSTN